MKCKFCKQGTIFNAMINKTHDHIRICDECDSVWYAERENIKITNFDRYMASKQLNLLWSEITLIDSDEQR